MAARRQSWRTDLRPRLAGITKLRLYKDRASRRAGGKLEPLFTGPVDAALILHSEYEPQVLGALALVE